MSVPSPSIAPAPVGGTTHNLLYQGDVNASGVSADLNISLMGFPEHIRLDPFFRENLVISFQTLNSNLTFAGPPVIPDSAYVPVPGTDPQPNEYVRIQVTSDLPTRQCVIGLTHRHSYTR